jgi:hypothetical protein
MEWRTPVAPVSCGECGTVHDQVSCPECDEQPNGVLVGVLQTEVTTEAGATWLVTAERDPVAGGWVPVVRQGVAPGFDTVGQVRS